MRRVFSAENMELAWDRLLRSSDRFSKWYWRDGASAASAAHPDLLRRLSADLRKRAFEPNHACIVSFPKKSGLLRHYPLLALGDHLVYQAIMNVVADAAYPRLRQYYGRCAFANQYAGPQSRFFYKPWIAGYRRFNDSCRAAWGAGSRWYAGFDFASYYDSIDHSALAEVLRHGYGVQDDVADLLGGLLGHWSASFGRPGKWERRYLGHGIPQGAHPSPLLSEVLLAYVDRWMVDQPDWTYLRYADDIRVFGDTELAVRHAAVRLDRLARNLGLFPQPGKVEIRCLEDVNEILKSVSTPNDEPVDTELHDLDASSPLDRLRSILDAGLVNDVTKFKWLLGTAEPDQRTAGRVVKLIPRMPELADSLIRYIERCAPVRGACVEGLLALLDSPPIYGWLAARALTTLMSERVRLTRGQEGSLRVKAARLRAIPSQETDAYLAAETMLAAVQYNSVTARDVEHWLKAETTEWWSVARFIAHVDLDAYGRSALHGLLTSCLAHGVREVERVAAFRLAQMQARMPIEDMHADARAVFRALGVSTKASAKYSRLNELIERLAAASGVPLAAGRPAINWRVLLGVEHDNVEAIAVRLLGYQGPNTNAFVCEMDVACDEVVKAIQHHRSYQLPRDIAKSARSPRGHLISANKQFGLDFPGVCAFCRDVNALRLRCETSHMYHHDSGKKIKTGRIPYRERVRVLRLLPGLISELQRDFPAT